jgi:peptidoglycan/LPS O-acetylase OafA/YrhL
MPEPIERQKRYVPGLDGLRAVAVLAVIAYHLGVPWAPGGMLGVGVFFTLSGYLITDLLLSHWRRVGHLDLAHFWLRRARRLLPALFFMLAVVSAWVAIADAGQLETFRRQALGAILYFSNWAAIVQHGSYFARFAPPLPLDHLWSLAIEEQFYLVWPWLLWLGLWAARRHQLAAMTLALGTVSALAMGLLYHPGFDPTRVYEGTDTRAFGLLVGAALAMVWPIGNLRRDVPAAARNLLDGLGGVGLAAIALLVWRSDPYSPFLYRGGMVLLTIATAAVVVAVVHPATRLSRVLGWGPLLWVGVRSYGIYLWHWPIIVLTSPADVPVGWLRAIVQVAATLAIAALSWRFVEEPIRRGTLGRVWGQLRAGAHPFAPFRGRLAAGSALTVVSVAFLGITGLLPACSSGGAAVADAGALRQSSLPVSAPPATGASPTGTPAASPSAAERVTRTSCRSVVYLGDSTSEGEISTSYIRDRARQLPARLAGVGVKHLDLEISGARSIVETYHGEDNAATVARRLVDEGFQGCWILAIGTNDTADVAVGSPIGRSTRVAEMMSIIGHRPVLWVDLASLRPSGPYSASLMRLWNRALLAACPRHPSMRIFDWAAVARPAWFIRDALHYNSVGSARRSQLIAQALVAAFPEGTNPSSSCVIR